MRPAYSRKSPPRVAAPRSPELVTARAKQRAPLFGLVQIEQVTCLSREGSIIRPDLLILS